MNYHSEVQEVQPVKSDVSSLATLQKSDSPNKLTTNENMQIPKPAIKWKSRIFLPAAILLILLGLIGWSMQDIILPTIKVQVIPAITQYAGSTISQPAKTTGKLAAKKNPQTPSAETSDSSAGKKVAQASVDNRANFEVSLAQLKNAKVLTKGSGWLEASPFETNATGLTHGIIEKIFVLEGQTVTKGQPIAQMITDDAKLELQQAKSAHTKSLAMVEAAKAQLQSAKLHWDNPIEQQRKVQTTSAALTEVKAELKKITSQITAQTAKLNILKDEYDRNITGHKKNVTSNSDLTKSKFAYEQQLAIVEATKQSRQISTAKLKRLESENAAAVRDLKLRIDEQNKLATAKAKLAEANAAVQVTKVALETAQLRLSRMIVRAPISGVIMKLEKIPGAKLMIKADDKLSAVVAKIYNPKKMQARIDVQLSNVARVFIGQYVRITVSIDASDDKKVFLGKVVRMLHQADIQKNTLEVKVELQSPTLLIKPDMIVRAEFFVPIAQQNINQNISKNTPVKTLNNKGELFGSAGDSELKILVPRSLIFESPGKKDCVLIADPATKTALLKQVTIGSFEKDNWIEITKGISQGDRIIATNPSKIKNGSRVKIVGEIENITKN